MYATTNAKAIARHDMIRRTPHGGVFFIEHASFVIYDNGVAMVSEHQKSAKNVSTKQARVIAKRLLSNGYQFGKATLLVLDRITQGGCAPCVIKKE